MSRRKLLTEDERAHLFGIPIDEAGLARHYTLSPDDLELLHAKRGARNILGAAVQLALLRHPGFGLRSDEVVADALLRYLAGQLSVRPVRFVTMPAGCKPGQSTPRSWPVFSAFACLDAAICP